MNLVIFIINYFKKKYKDYEKKIKKKIEENKKFLEKNGLLKFISNTIFVFQFF